MFLAITVIYKWVLHPYQKFINNCQFQSIKYFKLDSYLFLCYFKNLQLFLKSTFNLTIYVEPLPAEFCLGGETSVQLQAPPSCARCSCWSLPPSHSATGHRASSGSLLPSPFPSPALQRWVSFFRQGSGGSQRQVHHISVLWIGVSWERVFSLSAHYFQYENEQTQGTHLWKGELEEVKTLYLT